MGREVILDYHKMRNTQIRRVTTNNEAFAKLAEITNYPSLAVLKRDMSIIHLMPKSKTREGYSSSIHTFLVQNGGIEDANAVREIPREKDVFGQAETLIITSVNVPDVIYRVDLENTLRYCLSSSMNSPSATIALKFRHVETTTRDEHVHAVESPRRLYFFCSNTRNNWA